MERNVRQHEPAVLEWLLDRAAMGEGAGFRRQPLADLVVVGGWYCGCSSLDFRPRAAGSRILADALALYPDGQQAGLILWGREGEIIWLEVYDMPPGASHRFPEIADLRTYEQLGQGLL